MLHMMIKVRVPGMTMEGISDVGEDVVEDGEAAVEDAAHVDVLVHHEGVGAHVAALHDGVEDAMDPGEAPEQEQCTWDRRGKVEQQMGEHDNVGLDTDNGAGDLQVRIEDPLLHSGMQGELEAAEIDIVEDCRLEIRAVWAVQGLECREGGFVAALRCAVE